MAIQTIPIFGFPMRPTDPVFWLPANADPGFTNLGSGVFVFPDTSTKISLHGRFRVPAIWVETDDTNFEVEWTAGNNVITGNCVWDLDYRVVDGNDTASMDQTIDQEALTVTDAAPSAVDERLLATIGDATQGNFAAGATVNYILSRDGAVGGPTDTMVARALAFGLYFRYSDA